MQTPEIKLYNTLGRAKQVFTPIKEGHAQIYVCGVTVYDLCHLGHIRGAVNFDVLRNFLEAAGYQVLFVKNYTDVDDKIIERAAKNGMSCEELTGEMIRKHDEDMALFGVRPPNIAPRATEHISGMIEMISGLIAKGLAYESGGDVYFRSGEFDGYGQLSGKSLDGLEAGARIEVSGLKEGSYDFALWKSSKPGEPKWQSPWGEGRPGWHIECSAMCAHYLGEQFDIHGGGQDLIFPHHENEIAQSCGSCGKIPANYWMHNGMVEIEGHKMSKSIGNVLTADELVKSFHPEVIRFYILKTHYRQRLNYERRHVEDAAENLDRFYGIIRRFAATWPELVSASKQSRAISPDNPFFKAMADDLNTPEAIAWLFTEAKALNASQTDDPAARERLLDFIAAGQMLGALNEDPELWFSAPRIKTDRAGISEEEIRALIEERKQARAEKNWKRSDEIRDQLKEAGIELQDKNDETLWSYL